MGTNCKLGNFVFGTCNITSTNYDVSLVAWYTTCSRGYYYSCQIIIISELKQYYFYAKFLEEIRYENNVIA